MILINCIIEALLQLVLFSLIPFIFYVTTRKKVKGFFKFLGFTKPGGKWLTTSLIILIGSLAAYMIPMYYLKQSGSLESSLLSFNNFRHTSFSLGFIIEILIYAIFKTSLSEEIFFRGFLGKRFISKFGFKIGNFLQAIIFGLLHGIVFINYGIVAILIPVILSSVLGYLFGWINEVKCNGSIYPSWFIHGITNIISPLLFMLMF